MSVDADSLRTLAEVAAGLVGFAAVSVGLAVNRQGGLSVFDKVRFYWIVAGGLSVIIYAYVPSWLTIFGVLAAEVWFYSTLVLCLTIPLGLAIVVSPWIAARNTRSTVVREEEKKWFLRSNSIGLLLALAIIQNLTSWPIESNQATYELMLVIGMTQIAYNFVSLVVVPGSHDGPAGNS